MNQFRFQRSYRGHLKAVVCDWAGTMVDYGCCAPAVVFVDVFHREGVEITMDEAREPMGMQKKDHIRQVSQIVEVAKRWEAAHGKPCSEADVDRMYEAFIPLQIDCLADYADVIPGALETIAALRKRGLRIGSTTGYSSDMMDVLTAEAKKRGLEVDSMVCASDVPAGRPEPWMCLQNAQNMGVYPLSSIAKNGDTVPDIAEGLNAGMWSIGVATTGNEIGLKEDEVKKLPDEIYERKRQRAYQRLYQAGAHYVVDGIADVIECLDDIEQRLAGGEQP